MGVTFFLQVVKPARCLESIEVLSHTTGAPRAATGARLRMFLGRRSDRCAARVVNPVDPFGFNFTQSYTKHVRTVERIDRAHEKN
jgi:hypothetical protein